MHAMLLSGLREMLLTQLNIQGRAREQVVSILRLQSCNGIHAPNDLGCGDFKEFVEVIEQISAITGISPSDLKKRMGAFLLQKVVDSTPNLNQRYTNAFDLLETLEEQARLEIHFNDADSTPEQLQFDCVKEPERFTMLYRSPWPLADLVEGIIHGCITHFGEPIQIHKEDFSYGRGENTLFVLSKML